MNKFEDNCKATEHHNEADHNVNYILCHLGTDIGNPPAFNKKEKRKWKGMINYG